MEPTKREELLAEAAARVGARAECSAHRGGNSAEAAFPPSAMPDRLVGPIRF